MVNEEIISLSPLYFSLALLIPSPSLTLVLPKFGVYSSLYLSFQFFSKFSSWVLFSSPSLFLRFAVFLWGTLRVTAPWVRAVKDRQIPLLFNVKLFVCYVFT